MIHLFPRLLYQQEIQNRIPWNIPEDDIKNVIAFPRSLDKAAGCSKWIASIQDLQFKTSCTLKVTNYHILLHLLLFITICEILKLSFPSFISLDKSGGWTSIIQTYLGQTSLRYRLRVEMGFVFLDNPRWGRILSKRHCPRPSNDSHVNTCLYGHLLYSF